MEKRVSVSKVVINIDGKEIDFTLEQAKELSKILNDMFKPTPEKDIVYIPYVSEPYTYKKYWKWDWSDGTGNPPYKTGTVTFTCKSS